MSISLTPFDPFKMDLDTTVHSVDLDRQAVDTMASLDRARSEGLDPLKADFGNPKLMNNLRAYREEKERRGERPFDLAVAAGEKKLAEQHETRARKLVNLFQSDDATFKDILESNGDTEAFEMNEAFMPEGESLRGKYLKRQAMVEFGFDHSQITSGFAEPQLRQIIGAGEHEPTEDAVIRWGLQETNEIDRRRTIGESAHTAATNQFLRMSGSFDEFEKELETASPDLTDEERTQIRRIRNNRFEEMDSQLGKVRPLVRKAFNTIAADEGITSKFDSPLDTPFNDTNEAVQEFAKLPEDQFRGVLLMLSETAKTHGQDVDGFMNKVTRSWDRGLESVFGNASRRNQTTFANQVESYLTGGTDLYVWDDVPVGDVDAVYRSLSGDLLSGSTYGDPTKFEEVRPTLDLGGFRNKDESGNPTKKVDGKFVTESGEVTSRKRRVTKQELAALKERNVTHKQTIKYGSELSNWRESVAKVRSDNMFVNDWVYGTVRSLPEMGMAATGPMGVVVTGMAQSERSMQQMRRQYPDIDEGKLQNAADVAGFGYGLLNRLQFKALTSKMPGSNKWYSQFASTLVAETVIEQMQDGILPLTMELYSHVDADMPDINLMEETKEVLSRFPRTMFAMVPIAAAGVGGRKAMEYMDEKQLDRLIRDHDLQTMYGMNPSDFANIREMALPEALDYIQENNPRFLANMQELPEVVGPQGDFSITADPDGRFTVSGNNVTVKARSPEEAAEAARQIDPDAFTPEVVDGKAPVIDDAPYLAAVKSGDVEMQQKLADDAAEASGLVVAHHGTDSGHFDKFEEMGGKTTVLFSTFDVERKGFFFAEDLDLAQSFGERTVKVYLDVGNVADMSSFKDRTVDDRLVNELGWNEQYLLRTETWELFDDGKGEEFISALKELGYDSALIEEPGVEGEREQGLTRVMFDASQITFADPVARDVGGDVIPLSERFNQGGVAPQTTVSHSRIYKDPKTGFWYEQGREDEKGTPIPIGFTKEEATQFLTDEAAEQAPANEVVLDDLVARNDDNKTQAAGGYGKSGIPKKFFKPNLTEDQLGELDDWIGRKEEALVNYSESPTVDPNIEDLRQAEIDLAIELAERHQTFPDEQETTAPPAGPVEQSYQDDTIDPLLEDETVLHSMFFPPVGSVADFKNEPWAVVREGLPPTPDMETTGKVGLVAQKRFGIQSFLSGRDLPSKSLQKILDTQERRMRGVESQFNEIGKALDKRVKKHIGSLPLQRRDAEFKKIQEDAYKALRGDAVAMNALPPKIRTVVKKGRDSIDQYSQWLVDRGVVNKDLAKAIGDNVGSYVTREFKAFDPKAEWNIVTVKKQHPAIYQTALTEIMAGGLTQVEAEHVISEMLDPGKSMSFYMGASKVGKVDVTSFIKRKDLSTAILDLLGEVRNPAVNIRDTGKKVSSVLLVHDAQQAIGEWLLAAGLASRKADPSNRLTERIGEESYAYPIEDVDGKPAVAHGTRTAKAFSGFGTLYTTPEFKGELETYFKSSRGKQSQVEIGLNMLAKVTGIGKFAQVILNPAAYPTNFFGGISTELFNGRVSFDGKGTRAYLKFGSLRNIGTDPKDPYGVEDQMTLYSQTGADFDAAGGVNGMSRNMLNSEMEQMGVRDNSVFAEDLNQTIDRAFGPNGALSKGARVLSKGYSAADNAAKRAAFAHELDKWVKADPSQKMDVLIRRASEDVRSTTQNYDMVPSLLKTFSQRGIVVPTYVSFAYELVRNTAGTMKLATKELASGNKVLVQHGMKRIAGMVAVGTSLYLLNQTLSSVLTGLSYEEREKLRAGLPPWMDKSDAVFLSANSEELRYFDGSYLIPHQLFFNMAHNAVRAAQEGDATGIVVDPALTLADSFSDLNIFTSTISEVITNQKRGGGPVYNPETDPEGSASRTEKIADHFVKSMFTPGFIRTWDKAAKAQTGEVGFAGTTARMDDIALGVFGIRPQTIATSSPEFIQGNLVDYSFRSRDISAETTERRMNTLRKKDLKEGLAAGEDGLTPSQKEAVKKSDAAKARLTKEITATVGMFQALGVTDDRIRQGLKDANVPKEYRNLMHKKLRGE